MTMTVDDVCVTYTSAEGRSVEALANITTEVNDGEFIAIIGPSGCGKSTLLHALGGLIDPTVGSIYVDGKPIAGPDPKRAAFVFQEYSLLPWKSVIDNVAIGQRFAGMRKADCRQRAEALLALVGLQDFSGCYPRELSGGMQQRVAVARALCMEPSILLMDEPFGALDEQTRRHLGLEMSTTLSQAGTTSIMVTHSLEEAIMWADRVLVLGARPGRILKVLEVPEERPRTISYMASPAAARLRVELFELLELTT